METNITQMLQDIKNLLKNNNTRWLSLKDTVKHTNLSDATLRRAVKSGALKASHRTGKLLFKASDIERWLNG